MTRGRSRRVPVALAAGVCLVAPAGCTPGPDPTAPGSGDAATPSTSVATSSATPAPSRPADPSPQWRGSPGATPARAAPLDPGPPDPGPVDPARFDPARAMADVRLLAGRIGPRLATGPAFREAAAVVTRRFTRLGYTVRTQRFAVPAGDSWGVPVEAGTSTNVIALPSAWRPAAPYVLVGAHLDTVAVAPGAEDNASGVAVLLELARLASVAPTRLPVVLVAFGGEEPRGPGDDQHHFGSMHYVSTLGPAARRSLRAMVALDRVGVGASVPVCTGGLSPLGVRDDLLARARRLGIRAHPCRLTTSDHWSFEKAGLAVARLGSTPYAGYHSAGDVPTVVDPAQLGRTGRLIWDWTRAR